jgi:hypothetical protein
MAERSTKRHRACYLSTAHDNALAAVDMRCGFRLSKLSPGETWDGEGTPDLLLIDAGCAGSERNAASLLNAFDLHGGQVLLLGTSKAQPAWERWLRSGEAIFLRQPVSPSYLETLLRDIGGEIPALHGDTPQPVGLDQFGLLLGSSQPMRDLYLVLRMAAGSDASLCVHGESGTGKETGRALNPRLLLAQRRTLLRHQLRRHTLRAGRERALRPRARQLLRGRATAPRGFRARRGRHAAPR